MPKPYGQDVTNKITQLLFCKWKPAEIAAETGVSVKVVQRVQRNLRDYGTAKPPDPPGGRQPRGRPPVITGDVTTLLLEYLKRHPWVYQEEMTRFIDEECGSKVSKSAVSRLLSKEGSHREKGKWGKRTFDVDNEQRQEWKMAMRSVQPEQLVFVGESAFSDHSGWRRMPRAPIGQAERYHEDLTNGKKTWIVLAAYTNEGYLPCSQVRGGVFNNDVFYEWIVNQLLPHCYACNEENPQPRSVIVLDSNSAGIEERVFQAIESHGCKALVMPPYSPDLDPLELTFSVLKAWVNRHFATVWPEYSDDFGQFLCLAIRQSCCDAFAKAHFDYTEDGFAFNGDIYEFHLQLGTGAFEQKSGETEDGTQHTDVRQIEG